MQVVAIRLTFRVSFDANNGNDTLNGPKFGGAFVGNVKTHFKNSYQKSGPVTNVIQMSEATIIAKDNRGRTPITLTICLGSSS
jgi:hypothetical protein